MLVPLNQLGLLNHLIVLLIDYGLDFLPFNFLLVLRPYYNRLLLLVAQKLS